VKKHKEIVPLFHLSPPLFVTLVLFHGSTHNSTHTHTQRQKKGKGKPKKEEK